MTTAVVLMAFGIQLAMTLLLMVMLNRAALRWLKSSATSWRRIVIGTFSGQLAAIIVAVPFIYLTLGTTDPVKSLAIAGAGLVAGIVVECAVLMAIFRVSIRGSFLLYILKQFVVGTFAFVSAFLIQQYLCQSFRCQLNSMAPTILGDHITSACPNCGSSAYCSPPGNNLASESPLMICEAHFHMVNHDKYDKRTVAADHFLTATYMKPRRWDIVVIQYPEDPSKLFVERLIGLPGEEITIVEGSVLVRQEPPESLKGLRYEFEKSDSPFPVTIWGTTDHPAKLSQDEYFVLGDFSRRSNDSRYWQRGEEGHPPYAVPAANLKGVVTHIYWPFDRMKVLR